VVGHDGFNCFSDTGFIRVVVGQYPTITLGPDLTLASGTQQQLTSVVTNGPIATWRWTPATNLNCSSCPVPTAHIKTDMSYAVEVMNIFGCKASDTLQIKAFCEDAQVFIPNAFTPNNDGYNDIFMVRGRGILNVKSFRVFNRWGEVVFEKSNIAPNDPSQGWDGTVKGVKGGPEVFVYTADVVCENGATFTYKGNVSILK
jgi:gliding motility-associated-like protein